MVKAQMWQMNPDLLGRDQKDLVYKARKRLMVQFHEADGLPGYKRHEVRSLIMEMHRKNRKRYAKAFA
jgi:hypothetical protein